MNRDGEQRISAWARAGALVATALTMSMVDQVQAADFATRQDRPNAIRISGEIKPGDFARYNAYVEAKTKTIPAFDPRIAYLNSPGGDVAEALLFAEAFDKGFFTTMVVEGSICYSACTIMFAGGIDRAMDGTGRLGFHRLSLRRSEIDIRKAREATDPANQRVNRFFRRVGFPQLLVDKMNETPPSDIYLVDIMWVIDHEIERQLNDQPAFLDVVEKQCGPDPSMPNACRPRPNVFPTRAFNTWNDCAGRVKSTNMDLALLAQMDQAQEAKKKNLIDFAQAFKAMKWERVGDADSGTFIDRQSATWMGKKVSMWTLVNSVYNNKKSTTVFKNIFNCSGRSSTLVAAVSCGGLM